MDNIITLENVEKEYLLGETTVQALRGITLEIETGQFYSLIGPSGSGKSTLLHILGCMDRPTRGEIHFEGQALGKLSERELTRMRSRAIGFIFQAFHLNPILSASENVAIALRFLGHSKQESQIQAKICLERVSMGHRLAHFPAELSGGERQRVAIARAIVKKPALILADEPTGNLDTEMGREVISLMRQINQEEGTTIVQVTHDPEATAMSDQTIKMCDGKILL